MTAQTRFPNSDRIFNLKAGVLLFLCVFLFIALPCCPAPAARTDTEVMARLSKLSSKDMHIALNAAINMYSYWDKSDVPALLRALENKDPAVSAEAVNALLGLYEWSLPDDRLDDVIAAFKRLVKSEHRLVRHSAAVALAKLDYSRIPELMPVFREIVAEKTRPHSWMPGYDQDVMALLEKTGLEDGQTFPSARIYFYLSARPLLNFIIASGFVLLFWRSRRLKLTGKKVIYWPLLVPVIVWGGYALWTLLLTELGLRSDILTIGNIGIFSLFVATLAGLLPWAASLLWRSARGKQAAP